VSKFLIMFLNLRINFLFVMKK